MIRLAVFDIDRTLIPSKTGQMAQETVDAIHTLQRKGIHTAIASGRMLHLLPDELREIGFDYFIMSNGAYVADGKGRVLSQETVDADVIAAFSREMIRRGLAFDVRYVDGMVQGNPNLDVREAMKTFWDRQGMKFRPPKKFRWHVQPGEDQMPISFGACIPEELQAEMAAMFPKLDFLPVFEGPMCDVNPRGISKATGIRRICEMEGISMEQTIAFGDDRNDLEMIAEAGIGVAMGNGIRVVREAADYVTEDCADLGVVRALDHFGLI